MAREKTYVEKQLDRIEQKLDTLLKGAKPEKTKDK